MKKLAFLVLAAAVVAVIALQADATATTTIETQVPNAFTMDAPVFSPDGVDAGTECAADSTEMGPSCEKQCEKARKRCVRQGNGETYCYDNVFCTCMCDTCNNCIC